MLSGAWRRDSGGLVPAEADLSRLVPILLKTGSGALAWWRLAHSDVPPAAAAAPLHEVYRLHSLRSVVLAEKVAEAVSLLRSVGVEPLLGKGWAAARLYPHWGLRPYGDVDLYVRPQEYAVASAALRHHELSFPVDLHAGLPELEDLGAEAVCRRAIGVDVGGTSVQVFGAEDHLRLLCLHLLRHGAWRPLWLCDVGAAIESQPADFRWQTFLAGDARRAAWATCAVQLAVVLLGARLEGGPEGIGQPRLPAWILEAVLRQWGRHSFEPQGTRVPMASLLGQPGALLRGLRSRWPNPIEATFGVGGTINALPRLPFQLAECLRRTARFARPGWLHGG